MLPIIALILQILQLVIIVDVVLSWIKPDPTEFPRNITTQVTDPLYAPIRALIDPQKLGGIDISPLLILLLIGFMQRMLAG